MRCSNLCKFVDTGIKCANICKLLPCRKWSVDSGVVAQSSSPGDWDEDINYWWVIARERLSYYNARLFE